MEIARLRHFKRQIQIIEMDTHERRLDLRRQFNQQLREYHHNRTLLKGGGTEEEVMKTLNTFARNITENTRQITPTLYYDQGQIVLDIYFGC